MLSLAGALRGLDEGARVAEEVVGWTKRVLSTEYSVLSAFVDQCRENVTTFRQAVRLRPDASVRLPFEESTRHGSAFHERGHHVPILGDSCTVACRLRQPWRLAVEA